MEDKQKIKSLESKKKRTKSKKKQVYKAEKDRYFGFYDDIKVASHKVVDWWGLWKK